MPTVRLLGRPTFLCLFSQYHSPKPTAVRGSADDGAVYYGTKLNGA
jgi:hypothetical protein